ncbi:hypothetical protein [Williamsia soli]|uniref:hypothetical protein n=1 Tax=Williamsia soli TaxID=364929 RepID=UPI0027DC306D|nr:hypothetical protein [Williamsia soli]
MADALRNESDEAGSDGVQWDVTVHSDAYPLDDDASMDEIVDLIDPASRTEDMVLYLTDLPRRDDGTTPVIADISVPDRFAVISVPGLGGIAVDRRVRALTQAAVAEVVHPSSQDNHPEGRLTRSEDGSRVRYLAPSALSRLRLLGGMVYANRPWNVVTGMSKVMMAAFATGAVSLAYPTMWQLSTTMGPWRLTAVTVLASVALIAWLIIEHKLWERPHGASDRERAVLYNASTVLTLTIGVIVFHAGVYLLLLFTAWWTLPPQMVTDNTGQPFDFATLATMTWLVAAVSTLGGALGSGMEDDDAVTAAAYGARQRQRADRRTHTPFGTTPDSGNRK